RRTERGDARPDAGGFERRPDPGTKKAIAMRWMTCTVVFAVILPGVAAAQPGFPSSYSGEPQKTGIASTQTLPQLVDITFKQRLNEQLPLDAMFKDEDGHDVALGKFFGSKPVILAFGYYK